MPRLYSAQEVGRVLRRAGFALVSQRGSHQKFKKVTPAGELVAIVPDYREIAEGTFRSILDQARMTRSEFEQFM